MQCGIRCEASLLVFDLDGVLVDSKETVRHAYELVGVTVPEGAWGRPWQDWLPDVVGFDVAEAIHAAKNIAHLDLITSGNLKVLPPANVARYVVEEGLGDVSFLTGASADPALLTLEMLGFHHESFQAWTNANRATKKRLLAALASDEYDVTYIDDDPEAAADIAAAVPELRVITYEGQTEDELEKMLWTL